jgi:hypothetical protein
VKENISAADIFERLRHIYGDFCMGASSMPSLIKQFEDANRDIVNLPCSGRPRTATADFND